MLTHAFLVIAYNEPHILEAQMHLLAHGGVSFYVNIDKKTQGEKRKALVDVCRKYHAKVLHPAVDVRWGDYSLVDCELRLFKWAFSEGFDYYHLMSGVDLPIKSVEEIMSFFEQHKGENFIELWTSDYDAQDVTNKTRNYYFLLRYWRMGGILAGILRKCHLAFLFIQKKLGVNRCKYDDMKLWKSSEWVSLTHDAVGYLLEQKKYIRSRFRWTHSSDEIYKSTVIMNSPLKDSLYHSPAFPRGYTNLQLTDWQRGKPWVWRKDDFKELIDSPCLFARKFSSKYPEIIDLLISELAKK